MVSFECCKQDSSNAWVCRLAGLITAFCSKPDASIRRVLGLHSVSASVEASITFVSAYNTWIEIVSHASVVLVVDNVSASGAPFMKPAPYFAL